MSRLGRELLVRHRAWDRSSPLGPVGLELWSLLLLAVSHRQATSLIACSGPEPLAPASSLEVGHRAAFIKTRETGMSHFGPKPPSALVSAGVQRQNVSSQPKLLLCVFTV